MLRHISGPREMWRARDRVLTLLTYPPIKCYLRKVLLQSRFNPVSQPEIIIFPGLFQSATRWYVQRVSVTDNLHEISFC